MDKETCRLYIKITTKIGIDFLRQIHMIMNLLDVIIKMIAVEKVLLPFTIYATYITSSFNAISFNIFLILPSKENTNLQTFLILMTAYTFNKLSNIYNRFILRSEA